MQQRRENPAEQPNRDRRKWVDAFNGGMQSFSGNYAREFTPATMRLYMEICEGWSIEKMREVFRRAIESEKFCPTVATFKAYGAGVREPSQPVVAEYKAPKYTAEEAADIARMRADMAKVAASMPWSNPIPDHLLGRGSR